MGPYCTVPEGMNFTCKHVFGLDTVASLDVRLVSYMNALKLKHMY